MSAIAKLRAAWEARDAATTAQFASDEPWDDVLGYAVEKTSAALSDAVPAALAEAERANLVLEQWRSDYGALKAECVALRVEFYALYEAALRLRYVAEEGAIDRARQYLKSDESAVRDEMVQLRARVAELAGIINAHNAQLRNAGLMVLCPTCGNKRCPMATDAALACTGSNEPGQPGSRYA